MGDSTAVEGMRVPLDSSVYSQVVFDVPQAYPLYAPVVCTCHLTGGLKPTSQDWIGIFKVGWDTTQKYYNYVWADTSVDQGGPGPLTMKVVFKESYLPKDDGEFYQFCYVDSSGQVRGASTPFCFRNPAEGSQDCSLENDLLVVTTQEQVSQMEKEKEDLLAKLQHLEEQNEILRKELDERLREIHRLRVNISELKSNATSETQPAEEHKSEKVAQQQQSLVYEENETKADQEVQTLAFEDSLSEANEKYEKALQKIAMLKQERAQLKSQVEAQQAEISELKSTVKKSEQHINRVQDQLQLLQVDMQSSQKESERLHAELEQQMELKEELERLQEENKALNATLSEQGPLEGDKNNTKMQIQTLTSQLSEARAALRKEIQNSNEANLRTEKAVLELRELKNQLEQSAAGDRRQERIQIETELEEARRKITEQASMTEVARIENEHLSIENKKLKEEVESLQNLMSELEMASLPPVFNNPQQHESLPSLSSASNIYENIEDNSGLPSERNKVCRHCRESFPDISDDELVMHEQSHRVCPFCTLICDDLCQQDFENHVYGHEE